MAIIQSQFEFLDNKSDDALALNLTNILTNGNTASAPIVLRNGSVAAPSLTFANNTTFQSGFFSSSEGVVGLSLLSQSRFTWNANTGGVSVDGNTRFLVNGLSAAFNQPSQPLIAFTGDEDTGIYRPGANQLAIATGAVESVRFNSTTMVMSANGAGISLKSPDGSIFVLSVSNAGTLVITAVG